VAFCAVQDITSRSHRVTSPEFYEVGVHPSGDPSEAPSLSMIGEPGLLDLAQRLAWKAERRSRRPESQLRETERRLHDAEMRLHDGEKPLQRSRASIALGRETIAQRQA
jgi:hypothetical protein